MNKFKTKNYEIISKGKITEKIIKICKDYYKTNKLFFNKDGPYLKIIITNTEEEFKRLTKKFYSPWVKGVSLKGNRVILRGPELYKKTYKKFKGTQNPQLLLTHEINHIFAYQINLYRGPYWFTEGLATYVAKQIPGKSYKKSSKITKEEAKRLMFYRFMHKNLKQDMYVVHYKAIDYLIKKFGKKKLLKLVNSYSRNLNKKKYLNLFNKIYGISYGDFINEFIKDTNF
ncbi:hypothetical protein HOE04_01495 [archaeon]|jgi:hypothetical protein|nr:hypothetical protein [archaeon]